MSEPGTRRTVESSAHVLSPAERAVGWGEQVVLVIEKVERLVAGFTEILVDLHAFAALHEADLRFGGPVHRFVSCSTTTESLKSLMCLRLSRWSANILRIASQTAVRKLEPEPRPPIVTWPGKQSNL